MHAANAKTPLFVAHGTMDEVVSFDFGKMSADGLAGFGCAVEFKAYKMGHSTHAREIADLHAWLAARLPLAPPPSAKAAAAAAAAAASGHDDDGPVAKAEL